MADGDGADPAGTPRRPPPDNGIYPYLRWSALGFGAMAAYIAWGSWTYDEPPVWSFLAPRAEAIVVGAAVQDVADSEGNVRAFPRIEIRPAGTEDVPVALRGVTPTFYAGTEAEAGRIAGGYRPGDTIRVRVVGGAAFADRTDGADLFHAIFMTLMAMVILATGLLIRAPKGDPSTRPPLIRDKA